MNSGSNSEADYLGVVSVGKYTHNKQKRQKIWKMINTQEAKSFYDAHCNSNPPNAIVSAKNALNRITQ